MVVSKANNITKENLKRRRNQEAYQEALWTVVTMEGMMARQQAVDKVLGMLLAAAQQSAKPCQTRKRYQTADELKQEATRVWHNTPSPESFKPDWMALEPQLSGLERLYLLMSSCEQMMERCKKRESEKIAVQFLDVVQLNGSDNLGLQPILGEIQETLQANHRTLLTVTNNLNERLIPALGLTRKEFDELE